jgi:hypothetical protein
MNAQAEVLDMVPGAQETQRALSVSEQAFILTITDKPSYERGRELLLTIKDLMKEIRATFLPIINKAHQAHKEALMQAGKIEAPLLDAEKIIKQRMGIFLAEQERLRKLEEDRLRKIAEAEMEEGRLADALAAAEEGNIEESEAILDEVPAFVPPPIIPRTVETGSGISMVERWGATVTDLMQLVKAVAAGTVPLAAIQANTVFLGQQARSLKGEMKYPGVSAFSSNSIASGRR